MTVPISQSVKLIKAASGYIVTQYDDFQMLSPAWAFSTLDEAIAHIRAVFDRETA